MFRPDRHPHSDTDIFCWATPLDRTLRLFLGFLVTATVFASCTDTERRDTNAPLTSDLGTATTESTTTTAETSTWVGHSDETIPSAMPARTQLDWIVSILNDGGQMTDANIERRFSPAFLAQFPAVALRASIPPLFAAAKAPYTIESFEPFDLDEEDRKEHSAAEAVLLGTDGRRLYVEIAVTATAPNLIDWVMITPTPTPTEFPTPITLDAIDDRLTVLGPRSSLGVYEVTNGDCSPVHEIRAEATIALGSAFKLWILTALATEISAGQASWNETMSVTDELRSSPTGEIYELETGTEVTLEQLAEVMISVSDNTATDMLLDRLGRTAVERAMERAGVADPTVNVPMLSTGNLFALKYVADPPNADDYRALDEAEQRMLLAELDETILPWVGSEDALGDALAGSNADGVPFSEPRDLDIEWFATVDDLCRTLVHLSELAESPGLEPVASILELGEGDGPPFDRDRWPTIRFKGGSEAGVVAGAWWFEGPSGDRYVVAGGVANPDAAFDELDAILTIASAIELTE